MTYFMLETLFDWDEAKNAQSQQKHDVRFEYAVRIFDDESRLTFEDTRKEYGEQRFITLGEIDGRLFVVVYTMRNGKIRLISARKANRREQNRYGHRHLQA